MNQNNEQLHDTAAAYVLGALPEIEIQAFRREMMRDCELGRYVESLEAVGDSLLLAVEADDVPDSLGASIMAEARRDIEVAELVSSPRAAAPQERRARKGSWFLRPALGLVAVALLIAGGYAIGHNAGGSKPAAPTVAAVPFEAGADSNAGGKVVPIGDGSAGAVVKVENLDPNTDGEVYELWIARGEKVTRSSLFSVASDGTASSVVPEDITDADAVMITREPAGGSDQPTGDVLATAKI